MSKSPERDSRERSGRRRIHDAGATSLDRAALPQRKAGDLIIDRYLPGVSPEYREVARERLKAFLRALLEIVADLKRSEDERGGPASNP